MTSTTTRTLLLAALASPLFAHAEGHLGVTPVSAASLGFLHPLSGWDHLLAMVTVGLLGASLAGKHRFALPGTFLAAFGVGAGVALAGMPLIGSEWVISGSVLLFGAYLAFATVSKQIVYATVAVAALFHGHAHLAELPSGAGVVTYGLGMFAATAFLHVTGLLAGIGLQQRTPVATLRIAGGGIAACGAVLLGLLAAG